MKIIVDYFALNVSFGMQVFSLVTLPIQNLLLQEKN